jgi:hypothetical protein
LIHVEEMCMNKALQGISSDPSPNIAQSGDQHEFVHHQGQYEDGIKPGSHDGERRIPDLLECPDS